MQKYDTSGKQFQNFIRTVHFVYILSKFIEMTTDGETNMHIMTIASDCCLMPTQQFFSYIMKRTS